MSETTTYNPVVDGSKPVPKKKSARSAPSDPGNTRKDSSGTKRDGGNFLESKTRKFNIIPSNGG